MAKIIREDFSIEDFKKLVGEFIFTDTRISLPVEQLNSVKERLFKLGRTFQNAFHAYFEFSDNTRYDRLCSREVTFVKRLQKHNEEMKPDERKVFNLFWKHISEIIEADYMEWNDNYLRNSCNFFIHKVSKLE